MDHQKAVAALAILLLSLGCANLRWSLQKSLRSPGERFAAFPEAVWQDHDCGEHDLPFFVLERNELVPPRVRAGGEFNHRMVYALCPARPTEVVAGRLSTRIRFKGQPIVLDTVEDYELQPGRWVVDAFIVLPEQAEPGVYAYEVAFESSPLRFEKSLTFLVER